MNSPLIQLLVLAGIAIFLILRLKSVLGSREGFEKPQVPESGTNKARRDFEVIEGGPDHDIIDHVPEGSDAAQQLAAMKRVEPDFSVTQFVQGARGAYEMIVMGFENGKIDELIPFLTEDVYEAFAQVIEAREEQGLKIESEFVGVREVTISDVRFDEDSGLAEITMRFVGELTSVVRDRGGDIIEGSTSAIKRQKDNWTFARVMGTDDPNWRLSATDA